MALGYDYIKSKNVFGTQGCHVDTFLKTNSLLKILGGGGFPPQIKQELVMNSDQNSKKKKE